MATKTKAELKKSHDAMAKFLVEICDQSDRVYGPARRHSRVSKAYRKAIRLIEAAGFKYPPHS